MHTTRYIVNYKKRNITKDRLFERIVTQVEGTNGKVAIASSTLQLVDPPAINIHLTSLDKE